MKIEQYQLAQPALADMKAVTLAALMEAPEAGMSNADLGRTLGIYAGHKGHEGHISRTLLAMLEAEGVIEQDAQSKFWKVNKRT